MRITSFNFFIFLMLSVIIYYITPKKIRWFVLLIVSLFFFLATSSLNVLLYMIFSIGATYIGTRTINEKAKSEKAKKAALIITLLSIVIIIFVLKYINIFPMSFNLFGNLFGLNLSFGMINLIAPLGISYYTLSLIGYTVDVFRETTKPQKNILKHALFTCYYPILVSGPILRYQQIKDELFKENELDFNNIFYGFQRMVFGLLKKLVIADQLAIVVRTVFSNYHSYSSLHIIIALCFYAIQIYADFSGCMDIVIGASKMYGVKLPENFDSPFFSQNLSEFWRRWHISLGIWAKDYIMYPLLKSNLFQNIGKKIKNIFGKKLGKLIPTSLALLALWLLIGLWHGASYKYIFAAGILPWLYLTLSQLFEDLFKRINKLFSIRTDCFSFHLFQSLRTFGLMCFLWLFVCSPNLSDSLDVIKTIFTNLSMKSSVDLLLISKNVLIFSFVIVLIVDYLNYKNVNVLDKFNEQNIWFRWGMLFLLIIIILIYGAYGPGYDASDFIYGGF